MTQLFAWDFEGKPEWGFDYEGYLFTSCYSSRQNSIRYKSKITNFRKVKVVDEIEQKTYLTTEQLIKVYKSFNDEKLKELKVAWRADSSAARYEACSAARYEACSAAWSVAWSAAWSAAWSVAWPAARDADLAIRAKDKITKEQFNLLMQPWTSCNLSPFVEDWEAVLNPKVEEPKNFGAKVKDSTEKEFIGDGFGNWVVVGKPFLMTPILKWSDLINPIIKSEGVEN